MCKINDYRKELMGIAALWIFYFHVGECIFGESNWRLLKNIEWFIIKTGYCGVEIFLFLSGIGLVYAIHKETLKEFYFRRFIRVYPAFWIWFTLSTIIRSDSMTLLDYIKRITFYANWMENMLAYKWYIAAIFMFYLWFPLYYKILRDRKKPVKFTIIVMVIEIVLMSVFYDYIRSDLFLIINRLPIFELGILSGYLCLEKADNKLLSNELKKKDRYILGGLFGIAVGINYYLHRLEVDNWFTNLKSILNVFLALFVCFGFIQIFDKYEGILMQKMRFCLRFIGKCSLEFYLVHELVSLKVKSYGIFHMQYDFLNKVLETGVCLFTSLLGAWILSQIVRMVLNLTKSLKFHIL